MAASFPTNPAVNDTYSYGGTQWLWNGYAWQINSSATSLTLAYLAITGPHKLGSSDYTVDCTANSFTVTLPTAVGIGGRIYNIKNTGNGLITVATTSSQTIDGAASGTITLAQYACLTVQTTGVNWIIL